MSWIMKMYLEALGLALVSVVHLYCQPFMMKINCNLFVDLDTKVIKKKSVFEILLSLTCKIHICDIMSAS